MKLLLIAESFPTSTKVDLTGGVESADWYTAKLLANRGHEVTVYTNRWEGSLAEEKMLAIRVRRLTQAIPLAKREALSTRFMFASNVLKTAQKDSFDVVMGTNVFTQALAYLVATKKHLPVFARIPDIYIGEWLKNKGIVVGLIGELLERWVISRPFTKIISWSESTKQKLMNVGVNPASIVIIPGGIELETIQKTKATKQKAPTICTAARLVPYKKVDTLIEAIALLSKEFPKLKLYVLGDGPERKKLEVLAHARKISGRVTFYGFVADHNQVYRLIKESHLFSLPSVVEGFGLVTIEAMACGVPYVNSAIPPTIEVTKNGQGGLLFEPNNPKDLAEKIALLLKNEKLYNTKVREGLSLAKEYEWSKSVDQIERLFTEFIKAT